MKSLVDEIKFAVNIATLGSIAFLTWSILRESISAVSSTTLLWGSLLMLLSPIIRIFDAFARIVAKLYKEETFVNKFIEGISYLLFVTGLTLFAFVLLRVLMSL